MMESGKHQALVGLSTGEDISGSALASAQGGNRLQPTPVKTIASFQTGIAAVTHFFHRVKAAIGSKPCRVVVLPQALSLEAWEQMSIGAEVIKARDRVLNQIRFVPIADDWRHKSLPDGTRYQIGVIAEAFDRKIADEPRRKA